MKTRFAVAGTLPVLAGPVSSAHWKPVSVTPERSIYFDIDALVRDGNTVQAWDWQKFGSAQTSATWQGTFFWVKSLTNYHCAQRTTDAVLKVYFGNDGVEIKRAHLEGLRFPAAVEPDSLREKMLEMACNPPNPAVEPVAKPAADVGSAQAKLPEPAVKSEPAASKVDSAAAQSNPKKVDSKTAKADDKAAAIPKAQSTDAAIPGAGPAVQMVKRAERQAYSRTERMTSKKRFGGAVRLPKARLQPDLKGSRPGPASTSEPTHQLTDAGNDGMFN